MKTKSSWARHIVTTISEVALQVVTKPIAMLGCHVPLARLLMLWGISVLNVTLVLGQPPAPVNTPEATVKLDTSGEIDLRALVEYVAQKINLKFMYDPALVQKKVNVIAPEPIPVGSLLEVLQSILKTEGLVLADAGVEGWRRIVPLERLPEVASSTDEQTDLTKIGAAEGIVRIFTLREAVPSEVARLITPMLSKNGASVVAVDPQRLLIVTDIADNIRRISPMILLLDTSKNPIKVKFVAIKNKSSSEVAEQLRALLDARSKAVGKTEQEGTGIEVVVQPTANQLALIGNEVEIALAEELISTLDQEMPTSSAVFRLNYFSPDKMDEILKRMVDERSFKPPYRSRIEGSDLIVDSTPEILQLAEQLKSQLDTKNVPEEQSPIRFYKIKNVPAAELLETIQSIFSGGRIPSRKELPSSGWGRNDGISTGPNYPPLYGQNWGNPSLGPPLTPAVRIPLGMENSTQIPASSATPELQSETDTGAPSNAVNDLIGEAKVTVDIHTNSIIVLAKPEVQRFYATLIDELDKRRPQVLVEAKVVIIDTSDDFSLGVEVSGGGRNGLERLFAFTSYGFSQVNPVNGALQIVPGVGFNGTLVDPNTADVVVRALSSHRRARVLSAPRILVNDNAEGELSSVLEVPFTSVNASQTVATTSFAGFAQAGTTINVTPTISEDNYLQLDYSVTLNSFTGSGSEGVPPPRQTNEVRSRVSVPDGYTVIVGGLTNKNDSQQYRGLPWLELVPVVRELTGATSNSWKQTSLFVFLRPVILRDDKFKDLKYVSDYDMSAAGLETEFPDSEPELIR
ncbi:MAG: hypothetical protein J0M26_20480 [Planctomycetes bacterium]|nr:hypothetical protein [Planctomycetota bacterium]